MILSGPHKKLSALKTATFLTDNVFMPDQPQDDVKNSKSASGKWFNLPGKVCVSASVLKLWYIVSQIKTHQS